MTDGKYNCIAKTVQGLEEVLVRELQQQGAKLITPVVRGATFEADKRVLYRCNLHLRTAISIQVKIGEFQAKSADELYAGIREIDWENYLTLNQNFMVRTTVNSDFFEHSGFVALKAKDAIVDQFREKTGRRPSVNTNNPDIVPVVHIRDRQVSVLLDSSGEALFKRKYRIQGSLAPLNEVLAAGLIQLSGWDCKSDFYDPMCGSGTIAIEAAMLAANKAPGLLRDDFGFMHWPDYDVNLWQDLKQTATNAIKKPVARIFASDIDLHTLSLARTNARKAEVQDMIRFKKGSFFEAPFQTEDGIIIMNPPYGERIKVDDLNQLYEQIGSTLKHNYSGHSAYVLNYNKEAFKHVGLRPSKKIAMMNGPLACQLLKYELYSGSKKKQSKV